MVLGGDVSSSHSSLRCRACLQKMPMQEKPPIVTLGQKFRLKGKNTIYTVVQIKDNEILLMSEDGKASMLIQMDSLPLPGLESI